MNYEIILLKNGEQIAKCNVMESRGAGAIMFALGWLKSTNDADTVEVRDWLGDLAFSYVKSN